MSNVENSEQTPVEGSPPTPTAPARSAPQTRTGLAYQGGPVDADSLPQDPVPPKFPGYSASVMYKLEESEPDFGDLYQMNRQITLARIALNRATLNLGAARRDLVAAETQYRHKHALAMITSSGGSERQRIALADLLTQELQAEYKMRDAMVEEWIAQVRTMKYELDALQAQSHNLRAQMNMS